MTAAPRSELQKLARDLKEMERRKRECALEFYRPYPKQLEFHALGAAKHEIACIAANRSGKTFMAAAETAMHLTGRYPDWWLGKRFAEPIRAWAAGVTGIAVRDIVQAQLFGKPMVTSERGTGMVPKASIDWANGVSVAHGYSGLYDTVQVKHASGGVSTITLKTYEQARERWQGEALHLLWCDEEPPMELYSEGLTRLGTTGGIVLCTFTPLLGMSGVVMRYMNEPSPDRGFVSMTIDDAQHIPVEERERIIASYPAHEREARAKGVPMLGSGRIFQVAEESISEQTIATVPAHWARLWGLDWGIEHPFAAVLMAWDRDADCIHILATIRMKDARPIDHAAAMKPFGQEIPAAWPHDLARRDAVGGEPMSKIYRSHGVKMLPKHAHFPDGSISTEAGIMEMDERMRTGRLKVAAHLKDWFEEFRMYHRKDGLIVKERDDIMSATRIAVMQKRSAKGVALDEWGKPKSRTTVARGVDFDVFAPYSDAA